MMSKPTHRINEAACFIIGAGHSGSTLVGMILGSHPKVFYAGEAGKSRYLNDPKKPLRKRACKLCGLKCPIWSDFRLSEDIDIYEQLSLKTGRPIIVDSTKGADWLTLQRTRLKATTCKTSLIFLMRDGRAVLNSRLRKYPDKPIEDIVKQWVEQIDYAEEFFASHNGLKLKLHYEDFAMTPNAWVDRICEVLHIDSNKDLTCFWKAEHHPLGGNNGTQYQVKRTSDGFANHDAPCLDLNNSNQEYYSSLANGIHIDNRWKDELTSDARNAFERYAGSVNLRYAKI